MPMYEQVSPELIVNVLGKEYFITKKNQKKSCKKEIVDNDDFYIMGDLFKLLAIR